MLTLIQERMEEIHALCQEYGVARLEVFGSATGDAFDSERSDVDFLIEYQPETELGPWMGRYFELRERLEALLGRPVDLVMTGALRNRYFIQTVNQSRRLLYAA